MIAVLAAALVWLAVASLLALTIGRVIRIADRRDRQQP